jgi:hypothetical protein
MYLLRIIYGVVLIALLNGCYSSLRELNWKSKPLSKYQPSLASISDIDNYINIVKLDNNKFVTDELGSYYHSLSGNSLLRTYFSIQDEGVLKNLFSTSVGLLEPIYIYKDSELGPKIAINWEATERRYAFFTDKLHLKLLPLSATKNYQEIVEHDAVKNWKPTGGYTGKTRASMFNQSGLKADYIISGGLYEDFYINFPVRDNDFSMEEENYAYASRRINEVQSSIYFIPTKVANEYVSGSTQLLSGCSYIDIAEYKRQVSKMQNDYFLPFKVNKIETESTDFDSLRRARAKSLNEARESFRAATLKQAQNGANEEKACEVGITAIGISGYMSSSRLQ